MKKTVLFILVVIIAALSVMSVSAAPRAGYYDQVEQALVQFRQLRLLGHR